MIAKTLGRPSCLTLIAASGLLCAAAPAQAAGPEKGNLAVVKRFVSEGLGKADMSAFDATVDQNVVVHTGLSPTEPIKGREAYKKVFEQFAQSWPVTNMKLEQSFAAGNKVVVFFTADTVFKKDYYGVKATNQAVPMKEVHVYTLRNGRIVENQVGALNFPFEYIMFPALKDAVLGGLKTAN